jgi:hypothetical protein
MPGRVTPLWLESWHLVSSRGHSAKFLICAVHRFRSVAAPVEQLQRRFFELETYGDDWRVTVTHSELERVSAVLHGTSKGL